MSRDYVIRDDTSRFGLGRLHIMRAGEMVDLEPYVDRIEAEDRQIETIATWHDEELDNYHLYIAWRYKMADYPMWGRQIDGDLAGSIALAANNYHKKFGQWPNTAIVREGTTLPTSLIKVTSPDKKIILAEIELVAKPWPRSGDVLVYFDEEAIDDQKDRQ